ncbi:histidine kinase [Spirilliplanes yamanashiensis]|uniref:histidine kinase n=1 Tax=Spirilliplanes yamanashiensis TaxID=42233 RepID=A0A8J3Y4W0_9ACTN|nr:histidine kinase [Spirilliplanes yamanashiensis]
MEALFAGPGETRAALRATDWSATPLGPVEGWPEELRAAIRTVLPSEIPMLLWWGPDLVQIFNEPYRAFLGDKYPAAVGQRAVDCWAEIWHAIGPQAESALAGTATYARDQLLLLVRHGYLEETYWTFSYSPVRGADGSIAGIFVATSEVTDERLADRRMEALRVLGTVSIAAADTVADACRAAVRSLAGSSADLPVVAAYLRGRAPGAADRLEPVASIGLAPGSPLAEPVTATAGAPEVWRVAETGRPERLTAAAGGSFGGSPLGPAPVVSAVAVPLRVTGDDRPLGVLVAGINPYLDLDEQYRVFVELVADRVSTALTDALAYAAERDRAAALADIDEAKTRFFANLSHELRTPLTLIAGPVEETLADPALPVAHRDRLEMVRRNAGRLRRLVDNLLDVVRIEGGRLRPERQPTDLAALTRTVAESFAYGMSRAGLAFDVDAPTLPRPAHVDRDMWEKIVANLLSNALKYTLTGRVRLTLRDDGDAALLAVEDTGTGVAEEEQPLLFQRFHRVRGAAARSHEGAGIGLALISELAGLHGGTVGVRSAPDEGSTFTVRLPYGDPADGPAADAEPSSVDRYVAESLRWLPDEAPPRPGGHLPGAPTVLVVEDNADLRAFLAGLLAPHYTVLTEPDGRAALRRLETLRPDLVLTDVMMPEVDGFELLKALRADPRTALVPVVMLSGRAGEEAALEGLDGGADDYLTKPFSSAELLARVRANLELSRHRTRESAWRVAITDALQEAFCVVDGAGVLIEANDAFRRLVGSDMPLPARPPYPFWPDPVTDPQGWEHAEAAMRQVLSGASGRVRFPLRRADGHALHVEAVYSSIPDEVTGRRTYVATLRDITDELRAAERQDALTRLSTSLAEAADVSGVYAAGLAELGRALGARRAAVVAHGPAGPVVLAGAEPYAGDLAGLLEGPGGHDVYAQEEPGGPVRGLGAVVDSGVPRAAVWLEFDPPRVVGPADRAQFLTMCGTVSHALQRAKAADLQRTVALTLQRSILGPAELPPGFAARYEPAVQPLEVGGDWYDVVELPGSDGGCVAVVVGDCVGRGLPAAAVMGQLRSACRALLLQAKGPGEVLDALDGFARRIPGASATTVFCAIVDRHTGDVRYSAAGHPPGIVVHADGARDLLDDARSVPLATITVPGRPEATVRLRGGSSLLLYTDGLVERRGEMIDHGIARAAAAVAAHRDRPPAALVDGVVGDTLGGHGHDDDLALLAYRHEEPAAPFTRAIPAVPGELKSLRRAALAWLAAAGVADDDAEAVLIAVGRPARTPSSTATVSTRRAGSS